ncbi:RNA pseudouridine synthase [Sphingomonas sp. BGYR3]|uniref:RluA family pseudouridine synthase n=1 Tax=Sphingomonas sp. BGYR3 TaxID=2975483 RepID=UPI0021A3D3E1|nr:RNA pseudouridine synthase [Sphingomonas sp. BGYR3]MDG5487941.1 RNA pseudouridine synthase [Sphingomonas sp. BGYR3]
MLSDRVLFIDGEAVVIDKPSGLPVDRPRDRSASVEDMLDQLTFGFQRLPQPVHRLDRDTSGCLLLARNPKAMKRFGQTFEAGRVQKRYLAVIDGIPADSSGTIDLALSKVSSREEGWRMRGDPKGKPARTNWKRLATENGRALIGFYPENGRTHQIRVHAAEGLGMPVAGDPVYGTVLTGIPMLLHAAGLIVPREGKPKIEAFSPLPERFMALGFADPFAQPDG